jgi:hypothetical protein
MPVRIPQPAAVLATTHAVAALKAGDKVTVVINALRDGGPGGNLVSVTLSDGRVLGGGAE